MYSLDVFWKNALVKKMWKQIVKVFLDITIKNNLESQFLGA